MSRRKDSYADKRGLVARDMRGETISAVDFGWYEVDTPSSTPTRLADGLGWKSTLPRFPGN